MKQIILSNDTTSSFFIYICIDFKNLYAYAQL